MRDLVLVIYWWEADFCVGQTERRNRRQLVSAGHGTALRAAT